MDQHPSDQQTQILKASTDRLRQDLLSADAVADMDRMSLQEATARQKLQGQSDAERKLNMEKLEFEMRQFEREAELELTRMAEKEKNRETERMKLQLEERNRDRERERKKEEREGEKNMRLELEHEFRMKQLEVGRIAAWRGEGNPTGEVAERVEGPGGRKLAEHTKRYGEMLRSRIL